VRDDGEVADRRQGVGGRRVGGRGVGGHGGEGGGGRGVRGLAPDVLRVGGDGGGGVGANGNAEVAVGVGGRPGTGPPGEYGGQARRAGVGDVSAEDYAVAGALGRGQRDERGYTGHRRQGDVRAKPKVVNALGADHAKGTRLAGETEEA